MYDRLKTFLSIWDSFVFLPGGWAGAVIFKYKGPWRWLWLYNVQYYFTYVD